MDWDGYRFLVAVANMGSRSAAASWRATISKIIEELGFVMCRADNDVWMRPGVNAANEETKKSVASYFNPVKLVDRNRSTKGLEEMSGGPVESSETDETTAAQRCILRD